MTGQRIAVFGLGRSGVSVAKAAKARGADVHGYDEGPTDRISPEIRNEFQNLNISITASFESNWTTLETDLVVVSPGVSKFHPRLRTAIENGIPVISEVEFAYRIAKAPILAITGTNGKSTTTVMTYSALRVAGCESVLCGNIYGSGYNEISLTEAADVSTSDQILVAEVSSFQLEWVDSFRPMAATITNITDDHLNRYEGFDDYARTKRRIFENMGEGDTAVWKLGNALTEPPIREGLTVLKWSTQSSESWFDDSSLYLGSASIPLESLPFREPHNMENAATSMLLSKAIVGSGRDDLLLSSVQKFSGLRHRMERIGERYGIAIINNSMCTNPSAVVASSLGLPGMQRLLVGGVDKNMDFAVLRDHLREHEHAVYLFGASAEEINRQLGGGWPVFSTMREAFDSALAQAQKNETIMLAPGAASMDQFKDFRDRGETFREMAMEWLQS